jgi:hypothetical protein
MVQRAQLVVAVAHPDASLLKVRQKPGEDERTSSVDQFGSLFRADEDRPSLAGRRIAVFVLHDDVAVEVWLNRHEQSGSLSGF